MDAWDSGLCTIVRADKSALTYAFNEAEQQLIHESKDKPGIGFDINYRELLSCAFAVHTWGASWAASHRGDRMLPCHVHFRIDNTSTVSWQTKMASRNHRAQTIIRLLSLWETEWNLRFSSSHVAGVENIIADAGSRRSNCRAQHPFDRLGDALAYHLRTHSVAASTYDQYLKSLRKWFAWCHRRGITPTLTHMTTDIAIQHITDFIILGFHEGYGSGLPVRGSTISATLSGIRHFFAAAGLVFPSDHPQIRMLLKGIGRLDSPVQHKAPVSILQLELCHASLDMERSSNQAIWGVLCLVFFFLLRRSEIASQGRGSFVWFVLKAEDIAITDKSGAPTVSASAAASVHIRLTGSQTNQRGEPTLRMLNRSGHRVVCPVFGALCLLKARKSLPLSIPVAVFLNDQGVPECVSSTRIASVIQYAASISGSNPKAYSSRSLRARGAPHMYRAGIDSLTIQFHGRWASDTFKQYTRLCKESVSTLAARLVSGPKRMNNLQ